MNYITDRFLPDKAIDLVDEAAAKLRTEIESMPEPIEKLRRKIMQLQIEEEALNKETDEASKEKLAKLIDEKTKLQNEDMETVYGMGVQKIQSYGEHFTKIIIDFLEEQSAAGGADAETLQLTTELTPEQIEETTGITVAASPAREKKLPFYIAPGKLDEVELTDTCMISELTNRINELCDEEDQKNRKKLTAAFVNTLLIQKGYIEEATEGEEKVKHITEKGKEAGIQEEERYGKYGRKYYALVHTRESQEMILGELREYLADLTDE